MKQRRSAILAGSLALLIAGAGVSALIQPAHPPLASSVGPNLVQNAGFEKTNARGEPATNCILGGCVPVDWQNYTCDPPFTPYICYGLRRDTQSPARSGFNDPNLRMGLPEWKPSDVVNRVHSGKLASQWFGFYRVYDGGNLQTITTVPGRYCVLEAYVQTWSSNGDAGSSGAFTSDTGTQDDRDNSVFYLGVAPGRDAFAFTNATTWSRPFTYADGHYDKYIRIAMEFVPTSTETTIFIRNTRIWPLAHNDSYVDDVYVGCRDAASTVAPSATRTRTPTSAPTAAQPTPTPQSSAATPGPICPTVPACVPQVIVVTATPGLAPTATRTPTPVPTVTKTPTPAPTITRTPTVAPTAGNPTPTQIVPGVTPTGVIVVTPIGGSEPCGSYPCTRRVVQVYDLLVGLNVRSRPSLESNAVKYCCKQAGARVTIYSLHITQPEYWKGTLFGCFNPECTEWLAIQQLFSDGILREYMRYVVEPLG